MIATETAKVVVMAMAEMTTAAPDDKKEAMATTGVTTTARDVKSDETMEVTVEVETIMGVADSREEAAMATIAMVAAKQVEIRMEAVKETEVRTGAVKKVDMDTNLITAGRKAHTQKDSDMERAMVSPVAHHMVAAAPTEELPMTSLVLSRMRNSMLATAATRTSLVRHWVCFRASISRYRMRASTRRKL